MRRLPNDVSRCVGRFGLGPDDPICERREACLRYLDMQQQPQGESWGRIPVSTGLCRDGEDWMIGGEA